MKSDLYLQNGLIVTDSAAFIGGIVVHDGVIIEVVAGDAPVDAHEIINVHGKVIMPGVIDSHTHLQEPGRSHWERYTKATMAAAPSAQ
jgi:allantoinase